MDEQVADVVDGYDSDPVGVDGSAVAAPATGVPAVDEVLTQIDALDERPVQEHVAVFERAHETLRRALDAPGDPA